MFARRIGCALIALSLFACAAAEDGAAEDFGESTNAIVSGSVARGSSLTTTARVNLREGASTSDDVIRVMALGTVVTVLDAEPQNGFYHVSSDGDEGWAFAKYLKATAGNNANGGNGGEDPGTGASSGSTPTGPTQTCKASFYDEGQQTANGERFDPSALTAAHKTLPFNTRVRVTNPSTGKSVTVRINDRGPFVAGRCLDLSRAAFQAIGSTSAGVLTVNYQVL